MTQSLPVAKYEFNKWNLDDAYSLQNYIECTIYGEMSDGTKVWEDKNGNQYIRRRFFGKYFFTKL